jgi:hypothetical protein
MTTVTAITAARDEIDDHLATMCAAFDRGYTADRRNALRTAFVGKLSAPQIARLVEHLVGEQGADKMPTVREMWAAWRSLRAPARPRVEQAAAAGHGWSEWHRSANVALLSCAREYPRRDPQAGWEIARRLGAQFQTLADDGDAQPFESLKAAMLREYARLPEVA